MQHKKLLQDLLEDKVLLKLVNGQLKSCIDAHGPITSKWIGSAGKRVASGIQAYLTERLMALGEKGNEQE